MPETPLEVELSSAPPPSTIISTVVAVVAIEPAAAGRFAWKHCRHSTGLPCVGLKGTVVSIPHSEHSVRVSVRESPAATGPAPDSARTPADRFDLHGLQRLGSFLNCLSKKKSCSPAVKINCPPQSAHVKSLSMNSMPHLPSCRKKMRPWTFEWPPRRSLSSADRYLIFRGPAACCGTTLLRSKSVMND